MESIKIIAQNICVVLIITGIFTIFVPNKNFEKIMTFAISLFFICSVVLPIIKGEVALNFSFKSDYENYDYGELQSSIEDTLVTSSQRNLQVQILEILAQNNINAKKIEVSVNINENNSINISNVNIHITKDDEIFTLKIKEIINEEVGLIPKIIIDE